MNAPFESAFDHLARITRGLYGRRARAAHPDVGAGHVFVSLLEKLDALTDAAELEHKGMLDDPKSEAWRAGMEAARVEIRTANERTNAAIQERDAANALVKAWAERLPEVWQPAANPHTPWSDEWLAIERVNMRDQLGPLLNAATGLRDGTNGPEAAYEHARHVAAPPTRREARPVSTHDKEALIIDGLLDALARAWLADMFTALEPSDMEPDSEYTKIRASVHGRIDEALMAFRMELNKLAERGHTDADLEHLSETDYWQARVRELEKKPEGG